MILVTGGTGLLGSHLLYELVRKGEVVRALKRSDSDVNRVLQTFSYYTDNPEDLFDKIEWVDGDIIDYENLLTHFEDIETVYHLAAMVSFDKRDWQKMMNTNVGGTANIVNGCLEMGVRKFCFVSSSSAIGKPAEGTEADENTPWKFTKDSSAYGYSKFQSELEVWRGIEEGLNAVIVNPTIIIGPGNWGHGSSKMFPTIHKGMKYYTKGITGYVDVRNVISCMIKLIESNISGERFILSEGNYSYKEIFDKIADGLKVKLPRKYASPMLTSIVSKLDNLRSKITSTAPLITKEIADASHQIVKFDNRKIRDRLGFDFISVNETVMNTTIYYKKDITN